MSRHDNSAYLLDIKQAAIPLGNNFFFQIPFILFVTIEPIYTDTGNVQPVALVIADNGDVVNLRHARITVVIFRITCDNTFVLPGLAVIFRND